LESLYEQGGRCTGKNKLVLWARGSCCLTKIETCLIRGVAAGSETIHINFTKEAAAASIPNDIVFMKEVATTLENIPTCFEKGVAAASTKIHIFFLRDMAAGLKKYIHFLPKRWLLPQYQMTFSL
jgi:hypothetical protein